MAEKLFIENFLGIKKLEINVKKINIIIGSQASGKSICAKLLFYFKNFIPELIKIVENKKNKRDLDKEYLELFKQFFPVYSWGKDKFLVKYESDNNFIQVERINLNKSIIKLTYSDSYKKELYALKRIERKFYSQQIFGLSRVNEFQQKMLNHVHNNFNKYSTFNQFFIPAGRSFFATLQNNIFSFLSSNNSLEPFTKLFGQFYEQIKSIYKKKRRVFETDKQINKLVKDILCGRYFYEKEEDFLETLDGRKIRLSDSSSGQQEALPLTLILSAVNFLVPTGGGQTLYIEEPEAHLFPSAQKKIVELIATIFNNRKSESQFFITTHSPYILTAFNNLLQAGSLYQILNLDQQKYIETIISHNQAINLDDIAVYSLKDGYCIDILSEETELIDTNIIDAVSNELAMEFDKLLEFI